MPDAFDGFVARFPAYRDTARMDALRAAEYARLDCNGQTYLDYTGGSLYAESQLRRHMELMAAGSIASAPRVRSTLRCSRSTRRAP